MPENEYDPLLGSAAECTEECVSKPALDEEQRKKIADRIIRVMDDTKEYCRMEFSLEDMARLVESNTRYVSQTINETFGKNFRSFINDYRVEEASLRLMDIENYGNFTIKAIAESVGYKSHTNFIEIFKKSTGMTPSTYRKIAIEHKKDIQKIPDSRISENS